MQTWELDGLNLSCNQNTPTNFSEGFVPFIRAKVCACSQRGRQNTYSPHNIMSYFIDNRYAAHLLHLLLVFTLRTIVNSRKSRLHYIFQINMHNKNCLWGGKWGGKGWFWGGISHPPPPHGGATEPAPSRRDVCMRANHNSARRASCLIGWCGVPV